MKFKPIPIKNAAEIEKMRAACGVAVSILEKLCDMAAPGLSTKEIDDAAAEFMKEAGCRSAFLGYKKFPGHICISINDEVVHGIGGPRRLQYGDILKLDVGVIYDGWVGDTATTVPIGLISPETAALLDATKGALYHAIPYAKDGRRLGDLCHAIEEYIHQRGYSVVREFVGHGVGRKLHEEPQIPNFGKRGTGPILRAGMVLAIEPMVNAGRADVRILQDNWTVVTADGSMSAHFEHTVLVTKNQPEILTCREETLSKSKVK